MASFVVLATHLADLEVERRIDRVKQRGLPHSALTDDDALSSHKDTAQSFHIKAGLRADKNRPIAHPRINAHKRLERSGLDKIELVDAYHRSNAGTLAGDEKSIDEIRLKSRFGGARHDQRLFDVCDDDVLTVPTRATERPVTRLDALNNTLETTVWQIGVAEINAVPRDDNLTLICRYRLAFIFDKTNAFPILQCK